MSSARRDQFVVGQPRLRDARDHRNAELRDRVLGGDLVAHHIDGVCRRADECNTGVGEGGGEARVLGEKPVSGVDGLRAGAFCGGDDLRHVEVALASGRRAEEHRDVGLQDVARTGVGFAVYGNRPNTHVAQRPVHADRDLAAVGDQDRFERHHIGGGRGIMHDNLTS